MAKYSARNKNGDSGFDLMKKGCDIILFEAIPNGILSQTMVRRSDASWMVGNRMIVGVRKGVVRCG